MPVAPRKKKRTKALRRKVDPMIRAGGAAAAAPSSSPAIKPLVSKKVLAQSVEASKRRKALIKAEALERGGDEEWSQLILEHQSACLNLGRYEQYISATLDAERNCEALLRGERQLCGESVVEPARKRLTSAHKDAISPLSTANMGQCFVCPRLQANNDLVLVDRKVLDNLRTELGKRRVNGSRVASKMRTMEEKHQTFLTEMLVSVDAFEKTYTMLMEEIHMLRRATARHVQRRPAVLIPRTPIENGWTLPREQVAVDDPAMRTPFTGRNVEETRYNPSVVMRPKKRQKTKA